MEKYFKFISVILWLEFLIGLIAYIIFMTAYFKLNNSTAVNNFLVVLGLVSLITVGPALPLLFYKVSDLIEKDEVDVNAINENFVDVFKRLNKLEQSQKDE